MNTPTLSSDSSSTSYSEPHEVQSDLWTLLPALDASKLTISLTENPLPIPTTSRTTTKTHTDHMLTASWTAFSGWSAPRIVPYHLLALPPTASVLHYATTCFEGTKLYRGYDSKLRLFRPLENCRRFVDSATRVSLPVFEPDDLLRLLKELCRIDGARWLPEETSKGSFLYLRPTLIGIDADLECHVPREALLYIVVTHWPSSPTNEGKWAGLKLLASTEGSVRAWPGGSGNKKVGSNYGPTLPAHGKAQQKGFDQVLWLFGSEGMVTEAGGTNFFVIWKTKAGGLELATPSLESGLILPGITRRSVLELARSRFNTTVEWELDQTTVMAAQVEVEEKDFTISEIIEASQEGRLLSAFAVGTAYFVRPVCQIGFQERRIDVGTDIIPHAALLRKWLSDIMFGLEQNEWTEVIEG